MQGKTKFVSVVVLCILLAGFWTLSMDEATDQQQAVNSIQDSLPANVQANGSTKTFTNDQFSQLFIELPLPCLLYTSPSPRDATLSRMPSSA